MKKFLVSLSVLFVIGIAGCSNNEKREETAATSETASSVEQEVKEEDDTSWIGEKSYQELLKEFEEVTEKEDSNIFYKKGLCFYEIGNYQMALINFRKDREINDEKHKKIDEMFEEMSVYFDELDEEICQKMMNEIVPDEKKQEESIIKLYTLEDYTKRDKWFGYFDVDGELTYVLYDVEAETFEKLTSEDFSKKFYEHFLTEYQEKSPIYAVNDIQEYE